MRAFLTSALVLGLLSFSTVGLVGCGDESKVEDKQTIKTPEGTTTKTVTEKVEQSGNPPGGDVAK
jgi:hypothetical protein